MDAPRQTGRRTVIVYMAREALIQSPTLRQKPPPIDSTVARAVEGVKESW
jgi:hypothetical protein